MGFIAAVNIMFRMAVGQGTGGRYIKSCHDFILTNERILLIVKIR